MTRAHSLAVVAAVLLAASMMSACGSGGTPAAGNATPETVAENFLRSIGDDNADAFCTSITTDDGTKPRVQDDKQLKECKDGFTQLFGSVKGEKATAAATPVTVKDATVNGDRATITSDQIDGVAPGGTLSLVKLDGAWYVDAKALGNL